MRHVIPICALTVALALPAQAEEDTGQSLMEQGAELFFEGLRKEMEPALEDLQGLVSQFGPAMQSFFEEMGPALAELAGEIEDWSAYEAPEILPNGDIIIRKKPEDQHEEPGQIEEETDGATEI
ncbi:hypothetical protein RUE5091_00410 [Ruegeria denitrificans]|uniref:ATPases of the AAA+ class n=1 Tax=Ruegeria denitrificans TaxID=1715692 RepID=A0A0P1I2B8_9RHOB|nr:hypothetical protein [Ruegeria denitrificans]CUJ85965.1 hypothetical protein RUE5091_00410 [Ruegeria denitrificans]